MANVTVQHNDHVLNKASIRLIMIELVEEVMDYDTVSSDMQYLSMALTAIIAMGVLGNTVNIVVFSRRTMRAVSTFRFLLYLSLFDLLVLVVGSTEAFVQFRYHYEIRSVSPFTCRLHTFLTYFLSHCSSSLLMVVSIDRALVIAYLRSVFQSKRNKNTHAFGIQSNVETHEWLNTKSEQKLACCSVPKFNLHRVDMAMTCIACVLTILNAHYFLFLSLNQTQASQGVGEDFYQNSSSNYWNFEYKGKAGDIVKIENSKESRLVCFPVEDSLYKSFLVKIWTWLDLIIFSLVPFLTMSVCSVIILVKIRESSEKYLKVLMNRNTESNRDACQKRIRRDRQVLYMLLLTNFYFLLSSMPYFVSSLLYQGQRDDSPTAQPIVHLLLYTNNAVNFLFYGFSSEKYREEFIKVFSRKKINSDMRCMPAC
jgi:hypothetical protein